MASYFGWKSALFFTALGLPMLWLVGMLAGAILPGFIDWIVPFYLIATVGVIYLNWCNTLKGYASRRMLTGLACFYIPLSALAWPLSVKTIYLSWRAGDLHWT